MKRIIGRIDKADFPEFSIEDIDIKIDSGAYTSSIHCSNISEIVVNDEKMLKFTVLDAKHPQYNSKVYTTKKYTSKKVKSSNGISEARFMIQTKIIIFNKSYSIHLTLSERKDMKFPILMGRKFLNTKYIIDTTKQNLSHLLKYKNE